MALNNINFGNLGQDKQQMVRSTLDTIGKNPFIARMFDYMNEQGTPIQLGGGGLNNNQAAGTFFNQSGSVDSIILGDTSFDSPDRFSGDLFNEIYSGISVPGNVQEGRGDVSSFITQQQEFASFFGDGFAQEIAKGNDDPTAEEALANLDQFYGRSTGDVIKDSDSYGSLPKGSALSSALAWMGEKGFLPEDFVRDAQAIIDRTLGGGGSEGEAAQNAESKIKAQGAKDSKTKPADNKATGQPAAKMDDAKKQQLLQSLDKDVKHAAKEIKQNTGKDAKTIEKDHADKKDTAQKPGEQKSTAGPADKQPATRNQTDKKKAQPVTDKKPTATPVAGEANKPSGKAPPEGNKNVPPPPGATPPEKPQEKK